MTDKDCSCTVGYYKRFDKPTRRLDVLPHYSNIYSNYAKDYYPKKSEGEDLAKTRTSAAASKTPHQSARATKALPSNYATSYGKEFDSKRLPLDHREE